MYNYNLVSPMAVDDLLLIDVVDDAAVDDDVRTEVGVHVGNRPLDVLVGRPVCVQLMHI